MKDLAIVIPAYRSRFLRETLDSLVAQTCRDFTVYVGDDASRDPIGAVVGEYADRLDVVYQRFDTNLGSTDLVGQWERCVALTRGERWLWLFSDDDVMEPECVARFYAAATAAPEQGLFHFQTTVIEAHGGPTETRQFLKADFPPHLVPVEFLLRRLRYEVSSFVVEYVFRRDLLEATGGFVRYDLAWSSDDATWYRMAVAGGGIASIEGARVRWRKSDSNITPARDHDTSLRKLRATIDFLADHAEAVRSQAGGSHVLRRYILHQLLNSCEHLSTGEVSAQLADFSRRVAPISPLLRRPIAALLKTLNRIRS